MRRENVTKESRERRHRDKTVCAQANGRCRESPLDSIGALSLGFTGTTGSWRHYRWVWEKEHGSTTLVPPSGGTIPAPDDPGVTPPTTTGKAKKDDVLYATNTEWVLMELRVRTDTQVLYSYMRKLALDLGKEFVDFEAWLSQCPHDLYKAYGIEIGLVKHREVIPTE